MSVTNDVTKALVGKRILFQKRVSICGARNSMLQEGVVEDVAPSGSYIEIDSDGGGANWYSVVEIDVLEVLGDYERLDVPAHKKGV